MRCTWRVNSVYKVTTVTSQALSKLIHIFSKEEIIFFFLKKYASACSVLNSISPVHMKTIKRQKYDGAPVVIQRMTLAYSKTSVLVHPKVNESVAFINLSILGTAFENQRFRLPINAVYLLTCRRTAKTEAKTLFSKISGYVRTTLTKMIISYFQFIVILKLVSTI